MDKRKKRKIRHKRVRAVVNGTAERPRFSVFRSNTYIYAQLIDDAKGITLLAADDMERKAKNKELNKEKSAYRLGEVLAKKALEKGINSVVFDRGGYKYHGRVKSLADGARAGGLNF